MTDSDPTAPGGPLIAPSPHHVPVMRDEAVGWLAPRAGGLTLDATFGLGGYARAILATPGARVVGLDRDPTAVALGADLVEASGGRLALVESRFADMEASLAALGHVAVDGVVLDVGVSSMQLDRGERGFSFRLDGPLDMRMGGAGPSSGPSAADIVNGATAEHLADILHFYGEERFARPLARAIVAARAEAPILTTGRLSSVVSRVVRSKPGEAHPATRAFQGLRIAVNDELGELARALHAAERLLKPGGRLVVVAFHSLEDRVVKRFLAGRSGRATASRHAPLAPDEAPTFALLGPRPQVPSDTEVAANPRSRSARLRAAERTAAPPRDQDAEVMALAALPSPPPGRPAGRGKEGQRKAPAGKAKGRAR